MPEQQMIGKLVKRTLQMYRGYENARPFTRQVFESLNIQDPKLESGVIALREVLGLFEDIYQERQVMRANLQEQVEVEESFWNELTQITTLVANLDIIINDPDTLQHILETIDEKTLAIVSSRLGLGTKLKIVRGLEEAEKKDRAGL